MHDTIWFEVQGTPAVSVASSEFISAARSQSEALGMKDAKCVFIQHPIQGTLDEDIRLKADHIVDEIIKALTK
ncbi:MAG: hypothetical protein CBD08_002165 [Cellvibrionales bacterium TMED148]|nr:hypothetical protein [Porticoccaceae bacterium]RPG92559.1 MAG: hypothetical protein CBD08_002165 [Cellvibrionales bacterium TMED148]